MARKPIIGKVIGFTGTREQLTPDQRMMLAQQLMQQFATGARRFNQGCCVGGDEAATVLAKQIGYTVIAHPPTNKQYFSQKAYDLSDERLPEQDYLDRNRKIVDVSTMLIATPATPEEVVRSGTWATLRYAHQRQLLRVIIFPDGKVKYDTA